MGCVRYFQLDQRIFITVFPLSGFPGISSRTGQKTGTITHIPEYDKTIIFGVKILFHNFKFGRAINIFFSRHERERKVKGWSDGKQMLFAGGEEVDG